jgi:hypothetical protein
LAIAANHTDRTGITAGATRHPGTASATAVTTAIAASAAGRTGSARPPRPRGIATVSTIVAVTSGAISTPALAPDGTIVNERNGLEADIGIGADEQPTTQTSGATATPGAIGPLRRGVLDRQRSDSDSAGLDDKTGGGGRGPGAIQRVAATIDRHGNAGGQIESGERGLPGFADRPREGDGVAALDGRAVQRRHCRFKLGERTHDIAG